MGENRRSGAIARTDDRERDERERQKQLKTFD